MGKNRLFGIGLTFAVSLFMLIGLFLAGGCGEKKAPPAGKTQELNVALGETEVASLDPCNPKTTSSAWYVQPMIWETLVKNRLAGPEPMLAEKWEMSPDGKTWTFHLRKGVQFHNERPLTAEAVKFSIERALANTISGLGSRQPPVPVAAIETPSERTVVVNLSKPYGPFLSEVGSVYIVSPDCYKESEFKPIGTGPWVPQSLQPQEFVFKPFARYWQGEPKLGKVTLKCIPDPQARVMALESGAVDAVGVDLNGVEPAAAKRLAASGYQVSALHQAYLTAVYFNPKSEVLKDIRVRQAINYALDRQKMVAALLEGYGVPAKGPVGFDATIPWTNPNIQGYPCDPEKARALLKEAGFTQPAPLKLIFEGQRAYHKALAELVQAELAAVGIKVELLSYESAAFPKAVQAGQYDLAFIPCYGKKEVDPYPYMGMFFSSNGRYRMMESPDFDRLYATQIFTADQKEREKIYWAMQEEIMKNCPAAFLFHPDRITVMKKDISGWESYYGFDSLAALWKVSRGVK